MKETIETISQPVLTRVLDEWKRKLILWVPLAGFALALMAFFITVGAFYTGRAMVNREQIKSELRKEIQAEDYRQLRSELDELRKQLEVRTPLPRKSNAEKK